MRDGCETGKRRKREGGTTGREGELRREVKYWLQIKTRDVDQDKT